MKGISRILAALGTALMIAGVLGPIFGFNGGTFIPGIVLLFIGRAMAKQASRSKNGGETGQPTPQRALNTERRPEPATSPPPPRREPPARRTEPEPTPGPKPAEREAMLESILLAGSEVADEKASGDLPADEMETGPRMTSGEMITGAGAGRTRGGDMEGTPRKTSEEMIAEARRRWGHRP